jgi:uncharacterized protein (TIGR00297 family)
VAGEKHAQEMDGCQRMMEAGNQDKQQREGRLAWQSKRMLAVVLLPVVAALAAQLASFRLAPGLIWTGFAICTVFSLLVWGVRAATPAAAVTGGLLTLELYFSVPGWRTVLWVVLVLFLLTFGATQFGRGKKEKIGSAESRRGRSASQVAANLGAAAWMGILVWVAHLSITFPKRAALVALVAAAAEATADTLSSELGQVLGGNPILVTTLRRVTAGTDGAISLAGTLAGCLGAIAAVTVAALVLPLSWKMSLLALAGGIFGLFFDTLLGATLERGGWLNNDSVNFLSTLAAAVFAALCVACGIKQGF